MGILILLLFWWQSYKPIDVTPIAQALRNNQFSTALQFTEEQLKQNARDPQIWTLQGLAHTGLKEQTAALHDFKTALSLAPDYLPALKAEAQIEYATSNQQCVRTLQRIVSLQPDDPVSHAMLGAIAYQRQDCRAVVANYAASETLISSQMPALTEYGQCLFETGQKEKAAEAFAQAVTLDHVSWSARYNLAVVDLLLNRAADSLAALQPLLEKQPQEPQILDVAASAYEQMGNTPLAVQTLRQAIVIDPARSALYLHFADLCFAHNSFQAGIEMLNAGLQKLPKSPPLYLARGVLLVQLGEYAKAENDFAKAAELDPAQTSSSVAQGLTQLQQSNLDDALAVVRAKLKQNPDDGYLYYVKAETLRQKGMEPGTAAFQEALTAAEKAVQLNPKFPLAQDLLGTLYLRQNKLSMAIQQFNSALKVEPNNEQALYHLIVASRNSGQTRVIPELMKRLAQAKAFNKKQDEQMNRYTFVVEPDRKQNQLH